MPFGGTFQTSTVDMPKPNTIHSSALWLGVNLRTGTEKTFNRDWTKCSKYADHSRLHNQHDSGGTYMSSGLGNLYNHLVLIVSYILEEVTIYDSSTLVWKPSRKQLQDLQKHLVKC